MTTKNEREEPIFCPGGASRLMDSGGEDLTDDERAMLLALISVNAEIGRGLNVQERAALNKLKAQVKGYDAEELTRAVKHLVTAKPREGQKLEWTDLKQERRKRRLLENKEG